MTLMSDWLITDGAAAKKQKTATFEARTHTEILRQQGNKKRKMQLKRGFLNQTRLSTDAPKEGGNSGARDAPSEND